jgi:cytoskeletal protein RodZ
MDDFEQKLKSLKISKPSEGLKNRIFSQRSKKQPIKWIFLKRISLGWATVLAISIGLFGFFLAQFLYMQRTPSILREPSIVKIQIIESSTTRNVFDFTKTSVDFLPGELEVKTKSKGEV